MTMSDGEIITSYKQAKDPKSQIQILADLNGTDKQTMEVKLAELGLREMPPLRWFETLLQAARTV